MTKRVIAFAWAEEPLDFSDFLPPQSAADVPPVADPDDDVVLLSLPQADSVNAATAATDTVVPNALPMLLKLTAPTFPRRLGDTPATYAAAVDGTDMEGEREVNRFVNRILRAAAN